MIDVIIVDDEEMNIRYLKKLLENIREIRLLRSFTEPLKAIDYITQNRVDLVFLDIELPDINGLDCAIRMQDIQNDIKIAFVTAYSQYAIEAFKVHALHYLLKPVKLDQILDLVKYLKNIPEVRINNQNYDLNTKAQFFGKFRLLNTINQEIKWPTKKSAELCAYFILNSSKRLQKYQICEDIWPDIPEEKSSRNFHVTLFRLRNILISEGIPVKIFAVKGSNEGYICDASSIVYEQDEYMQLLNINNKTRFKDVKEILTNLQGAFLEENDYSWSEKIQHQMNTELLDRVHQLIREVENLNRKEAIDITRQALRIFKTDESLMMHYFNLLLRDNEIYQIVHEYEKYKIMLKNDYNLNPSSELRTFVNKII